MRRTLVAGFLLATLLTAAVGSATAAALPRAKVRAVTKLFAAEMAKQRIPGLSAAIVVDRRLVWSDGFGIADVENQVPATAVTAYRTASVGKTLTAVAAMQLAERGALDLDAPARRYCPAFPEKRWEPTARQLLSHQGGVRHYNGDPAELLSTRHYDSITESLEQFRDDPLVAEPGTIFLYSSYGYTLLGCVIEGASGTTFLAYLDRNVFEPAGMTATRDDDPAAIIRHRAAGYVRGDDGVLRNSPHVDMSNKMPAGGFLTTAGDLARFAAALLRGELVRPETFEEMLTAQATRDGSPTTYGLGWGLSSPDDLWHGEREALHGGGTPQVSAMLYLLPDRGFAVAFLANLEGMQDRVALAAHIAEIVLDLGSEANP